MATSSPDHRKSRPTSLKIYIVVVCSSYTPHSGAMSLCVECLVRMDVLVDLEIRCRQAGLEESIVTALAAWRTHQTGWAVRPSVH